MPYYRKYHGDENWQAVTTQTVRAALMNNYHNPSLCLLLLQTTSQIIRTPFARYLYSHEKPQPET